jgi:hypothetical protein
MTALGRFAFAPALAVLAVAGCGGPEADQTYPVSGRITSRGQPLAQGTVTFVPEAGGSRVATGEIQPDGSYTLTTIAPSDGALPGKYRVTITAEEVVPSKVKGAVVARAALSPEEARRAPTRSLIPAKYGLPEASGLSAVVEARSNTADFDLER